MSGRTALSTLLAVALIQPPALAQPPVVPDGESVSIDGQVVVTEGVGANCTFSGLADPDGRRRREDVSRNTVVFAASHAKAGAPKPNGNPIAVPENPQTGVLPGPGFIPRVNLIDDEIFGALQAAGVRSAPLSSDTEFLRRITLDLAGRIPAASEVTAFLADHAPDKRARKIDEILASDAFVDRWAFYYDDMFRNTALAGSGRLFVQGRDGFHSYFVDAVRTRKPYDAMARELISSSGVNSATATGATNLMVRNIQSNGPQQDTLDNLGADTAAKFLGAGAIFCTSCHNGAGHLDQINLWGSEIRRQDFWGMSSFFSQVRIPRDGYALGNYFYTISDDLSRRDYKLNTTTGNKTTRDGTWTIPSGLTSIPPKYIFSGAAPGNGETYRAAYARLVTQDPQFARAAANYFWKELFGVGIVEPADAWDFARQDPAAPPPEPWTLQPTHPNLSVKLGQKFQELGYDVRGLLRFITTSNAYQLSSFYPGEWKDAYASKFARHFVRRLGAEMLWDAISSATNVAPNLIVETYPAPLKKAIQLPDIAEPRTNPNVRAFLDAFLRGDRDENPRSYEFSILQALQAMNSPVAVTNRVKATTQGSTVASLMKANAPNDAVVDGIWLATLSRYPSADERSAAVAMLASPPAGQTKWNVAEDLQWSALNKLDFLLKY